MKFKIKEEVINLIYPPKCPLCKTIIGRREKICMECSVLVPRIQTPCCLKCGCEIEDEEVEYCIDCTNKTRSYIKGYPAMNYIGAMRECVAEFKYHSMKCYGDFFADEICKKYGKEIRTLEIDALVPVPVHKQKLKIRGYNQAEVLAKDLGERLDIKVDSSLLIRNINTLPQKKLDDMERENNLKRAFISSDKIVKYKSVMLVDDIYTTGSTIEACSRALMEKGIEKIYYTSICIGRR